jgi:hypothetical protein
MTKAPSYWIDMKATREQKPISIPEGKVPAKERNSISTQLIHSDTCNLYSIKVRVIDQLWTDPEELQLQLQPLSHYSQQSIT